jgi:prepilin-type N-terminal cleavage/methylation domain-containing protein
MMVRKRRRRGEDGFSLIEVMIAVTFLGVGLLAIAQLIPVGMAGITQARLRTNAVHAAQEQLDALRSADFDSTALIAGDYSEENGKFSLDWTITDDQPVTGMKRVDLSVSWPEPSGTKTVDFNTFLSPTD